MLIHDRYGLVVTIVAAVGAVLAVTSVLRPALLPTVRVYLRLTVFAVGVQVVIGIALVFGGHRPSALHWFYGAATLVALPLAMLIGGSRDARTEPLWVMGGAVATLLFAFRAMTTG